jgi:hypothetical protein
MEFPDQSGESAGWIGVPAAAVALSMILGAGCSKDRTASRFGGHRIVPFGQMRGRPTTLGRDLLRDLKPGETAGPPSLGVDLIQNTPGPKQDGALGVATGGSSEPSIFK